jgi:very-short-patch-repair endonuclease
LHSFVLIAESGVTIDVLAECNLGERRIYTRKDMDAGVVPDYPALFMPGLHTAIGVLSFLHENGHVEQLQDAKFMAWQQTLPSDSPRRSESSPQEAALEFNANERLVERVLAWRQRGVDFMGSYPVDFEDDFIKRVLELPGGKDVQEEIRTMKVMSLEQLLRLQLLQHCLSERAF